MTNPAPFPLLPYCPSRLAGQLLNGGERILLYGEAGIGKSTLTSELVRELSGRGLNCFCISADPGSPSFGMPGTVSLGKWQESDWQVLTCEALCTLDTGRFRLPLLSAVNRLIQKTPLGLLLIDAPGVVRGIAGSELLTGMVELLGIDTVLVLNCRHSKLLPLMNELLSLGVRILPVHTHPDACRPGQKTRAHKRARQWRIYLFVNHEITINLADLRLIAAPPPIDVPDAWTGRQCAFLDNAQTVSIGEIIVLQDRKLYIRLPEAAATLQHCWCAMLVATKTVCSSAPRRLRPVICNSCHRPMPCPIRLKITAADHGRRSKCVACTLR
jgi:ribonuclease Z